VTTTETTLHVVCAASEQELSPHLEAWRMLASRAVHGEWWAGPDWMLPWLTAFGAPYEPAIFLVYAESQLVGVVPMVRHRHRALGSARWTLPRNSHIRRIGWLSDIDPTDLLVSVFRACRRMSPYGAIAFPQIPAAETWESPLEAAIERCGLSTYRVEESESAVVDVSEGWDAYVQSRDGKLLRSLKRHLKRLTAEQGWHFEFHHDRSTIDAAWQAVLDVERRSWKHGNGSSIANEAGTAVLYGDVVQRFAARDALQLWILRHEGAPVAHALGVVDRGCYYLLKNSFDEAYRSASPGVALVWYAMREATERGAVRLDFLGDATEWKRPLATHFPAYFTWTIYPPTHVLARWRAFSEEVIKPVWRRARAAIQSKPAP
jgi:CelD/BcsL family acetyltransferase involved in cellulose biosynthesis